MQSAGGCLVDLGPAALVGRTQRSTTSDPFGAARRRCPACRPSSPQSAGPSRRYGRRAPNGMIVISRNGARRCGAPGNKASAGPSATGGGEEGERRHDPAPAAAKGHLRSYKARTGLGGGCSGTRRRPPEGAPDGARARFSNGEPQDQRDLPSGRQAQIRRRSDGSFACARAAGTSGGLPSRKPEAVQPASS